jgi:hypothetical protein
MRMGQEPCHRPPCSAADPPARSKRVIGAARSGAATLGLWQERRTRISEVRRAQHAHGGQQPPRLPEGCSERAHVSRMGHVCRHEPVLDDLDVGPARSLRQEEAPPPRTDARGPAVLGDGGSPEEHEADREEEEQDRGPKQPRGVCMQVEQEAHEQETEACKPSFLNQGADSRVREGLAGSDHRDECRDELHVGRAPERSAQHWWGMPGRADQGMEDARLPLTCVLSACCWCA